MPTFAGNWHNELRAALAWHGLCIDTLIFLFSFFFKCLSVDSVYLYMPLTSNIQPFTNGFPRVDIHELLAPDLLHQVIKGTFKDHLITWVGQYLVITHGQTCTNEILDDIDRQQVT
jgi:hypothetical protein